MVFARLIESTVVKDVHVRVDDERGRVECVVDTCTDHGSSEQDRMHAFDRAS